MGDQRFQSIQALRCLAVVMVLFMHVLQHAPAISGSMGPFAAGHLSEIGAAGVDIFFVLSGFVITLTGPLARPRPSGRAFLWRRWRRVAPIFYVVSALTVAAMGARAALNWPQTLATLLFWPAAGPALVRPYLEPGWTLTFEMVFYTAVAAMLIGGRLKRNALILATVLCVLMALRPIAPWNGLKILANAIFIEFALGAALARALPWLRSLSPRIGLALIGVAATAFAAEAMVGMGDAFTWQATVRDSDAMFRVVVFGLPAASLAAGALICEPWARGPVVRALAFLGDASYSIYLVQILARASLTALWLASALRPPPTVFVISEIAGCLMIGVICHLLVEKPLLRAIKAIGVLGRSPEAGGEASASGALGQSGLRKSAKRFSARSPL